MQFFEETDISDMILEQFEYEKNEGLISFSKHTV